MDRSNMSVEELADWLSPSEEELLLGRAEGWDSWMFGVGSDLVAIGLGRKEAGSIYFDTPKANALIERLTGANHDIN